MSFAILLIVNVISTTAFGNPLTPGLENIYGENEDVQLPQSMDLPIDVHFSAFRLSRFDRSKEIHKPVKFEGVKYNKGDHFEPQTGFFTAPSFGIYVFNFTSYKSVGRKLRLMKNNFEIEVLSDDGKGKAKNGSGRNIILQLDKNDRVWLRLVHGKHHSTETNSTSTLTTFSGRLLTAELNNDRHAENQRTSHTRNRRSAVSGHVESPLERMIRDVDSPPVTLVEKQLEETPLFANMRPSGEVTIEGGPTNQKIAFSVTCTKSMIGGHMADTRASLKGAMSPEPSPNGRLAFDKILVNIGDGFDIGTGEFIAPTDGTYFFTFNVGKFPRKKLSVMLMKNVNEVQSIIYNDSKTKAREIQGQSLMLQLKKNDRVWLRSFNNEEYAVYSNLGNYITFSGYLIYAA